MQRSCGEGATVPGIRGTAGRPSPGSPAETPDHRHIELSANIEFAEEIEFATDAGIRRDRAVPHRKPAASAGRPTPPKRSSTRSTRPWPKRIYPHPVIFRTFDVGGDKLAPDIHHEENPFLGWRGIRVLLDRPELFLDPAARNAPCQQRRNVRIMFPMVSTIEEVRRAKEFVDAGQEGTRKRKGSRSTRTSRSA